MTSSGDWLVDDSLAPDTDGSLAPLYDASARGELALPFCARCDLALELEQVRCDGCGAADVSWRAVEARGVVHATTTVHRREPGLILSDAPYHVVDVEVVSGHRLPMTTVVPTAEPPAVGDAAMVVFRRVGGVAIPALGVGPSTASSAEEAR